MSNNKMTHIWFWKDKLSKRKGQFCRILKQGNKNATLIEFADGFKVATLYYTVRKIK